MLFSVTVSDLLSQDPFSPWTEFVGSSGLRDQHMSGRESSFTRFDMGQCLDDEHTVCLGISGTTESHDPTGNEIVTGVSLTQLSRIKWST